jgi:raffinose/stachyose/melibiose transport system substrate-binding protein
MFRTTSARILIAAGALTALGGGSALSQSTAPNVSFTYMTFVDQATDQVGACIDTYTASHPNVSIEYQIVDHDALQQKLVTQVETNTLPDMFWWNGQLIVDAFNKSSSVLDLTPYLDESFTGSLIDGATANISTADGKIVAFPANAEVQGWVFNKALFDKYGLTIPTTIDELKAVVPVFRQNDVDTIAYGSKEGWAVWGFQHWLELWGIWQQAPQVFGDHSIKAVDADFQHAYQTEAELYALGAFPANNATMSFDQAVSEFNSGSAAMITLPSDQLGKIIGQPNEADYVMNWGITFPDSPYPQDVKVRNVGNGYGISANVANDPAKLAAIIDFNKWRYTQEGFDCALSKAGSIMPVKLTPDASATGPIMTQQVAMMADPNVDTSINHGLNSDYAPYFQWNSDGDLWAEGFGNIRGNLENSLMNGSMTAADIPGELAKMDDGIDDVIAQLKQ